MKISERLKSLRLESGKTQKEVAQELDILTEAYRRWENGRSNPKKTVWKNLPKYLMFRLVIFWVRQTFVHQIEFIILWNNYLNPGKRILLIMESQLEQQKEDNKIIHLKNSLVPYEIATEQALSAGLEKAILIILKLLLFTGIKILIMI
ncbi:helix-turn-helix domain-containing protein [Lactococcus lactis]|nr:helix-turn-helix domain-containing protein [Lactococcus lactis]